MDRLDEFHGLRRSERLACKTPPAERRRPENLGPGFLSCMYEDWRPSRGKRRRRESECSYLNELPDEILQHILSRLEVKEAARTCVVSRRWRNLWTSSTTYETSPSLKYTRSLLAATYLRRYDEYASSGAMVVRYRGRASTFDSVILAFDSEKDCSIHHDYSALNEWIQTKLSYVAQGRCCIPKRSISIPFAPVLDTAGSLQNAKLTALYFNSVALSFMDFADCTRLFPNLETLVVVNAPMYKAIVSSYSPPRNLRLKHLEIRYCKYLRYVRIYSAPNLETFKLAKNGEGTISILGQIQKCASVYLEGTFCVKMISEVQRAMPQLEQLEFNMDLIREMSLTPALHFPEFNTVKHLKLIFNFSSSQHNRNLMDLALFVMACPFLQKLTLVYGCRKLRRQHDGEDDHKHIHYDEESMKSYTHQHLQVVEFLGWCGQENEVQFANCMIKTATQLQDLIFYPSTPQHTDRSGSQTFDQASGQTDSVKKALASARRLIKKFKIIKSSRP